ncbi:MAG: hypothetical protein HFG27_11660 [Provencibacterium sp.]|jgi:hypothetical protein|nr:hypothetical protein [Provencibacterium sp.]
MKATPPLSGVAFYMALSFACAMFGIIHTLKPARRFFKRGFPLQQPCLSRPFPKREAFGKSSRQIFFIDVFSLERWSSLW